MWYTSIVIVWTGRAPRTGHRIAAETHHDRGQTVLCRFFRHIVQFHAIWLFILLDVI
jgi:hypothetical protein